MASVNQGVTSYTLEESWGLPTPSFPAPAPLPARAPVEGRTSIVGVFQSQGGFLQPGGGFSDLGSSQARQVENLGNSPAGQLGFPTGSSGNAYGASGDKSLAGGNDTSSRPAKRFGPLSPTGTGTVNDSRQDSVTVTSKTDGRDNKTASQQRPTTRKP